MRNLKKISSRILRPIIQLTILLILGMVNLSATWESPDWILSDLDRQIEQRQDRPALSSGLHEDSSWESFNEWQCFPISEIRFTCAHHALTPENLPLVWTEVASIQVERSGQLMSFDFEDWRSVECEAILREIKAMISEERSLCIYAAYLQELDEDHSYWIPTMLKTSKGYWPNEESIVRPNITITEENDLEWKEK